MYLFKGRGLFAAYDDECMQLYPISKQTYIQSIPYSSILTSQDDSQLMKQSLADFRDIVKKPFIKKIMLCVSNDCNLRCKYCYAQGGNYGRARFLMNSDTAIKFIDFCYEQFSGVESIIFFGGEPMLNFSIMKLVCERFSQICKGWIKQPKFGVITNGTITNDAIFNFVKQYISNITVSIDGPKFINDFNRIDAFGNGSFNRIDQFIRKYSQIKSIEFSYEATFTKYHIKTKYDYVKLKKFFQNKYHIIGSIVNEDSLNNTYSIEYLKIISKEKIISSNFECLPADFWHYLELIVYKRKNSLCQIGEKSFSVYPDGDIYLCHLLNGKRNACIGSIRDNYKISILKYQDQKNIFPISTNRTQCLDCWCRSLCGGCTVSIFYDKVSKDISRSPNSDYCKLFRQYAEQMLLLIAKIKTDSTLWNGMLNFIKTI